MLFDLKPKEKLKDFFNYREELNSLINHLNDNTTRLIVLRGLRRTGKSSLLRVALSETKLKHLLVDARELTSLSRRSFESKLLVELKSIKGLPASLLDRIESIEMGVRVSTKKREDLWGLLKEINPLIAVDEIQMLKGTGVDAFFAAVFDNTNCKIILTGSEIGVLESFLGKDNPTSPLFGRLYREIRTHPFNSEQSKEFLMAGTDEADIHLDEKMIEKAVEELDGIVGWLTMFGNLTLSVKPDVALKRTVKEGALLAYSELRSFLDGRMQAKGRYLSMLRLLAKGGMSWSNLKRSLQIELNEIISDSQFTNYLNSLVDYGFVVKSEGAYEIPDPLLKKALLGGSTHRAW